MMPDSTSLAVIVPTYNAAGHWPDLQRSFSLQGIRPDQVLVIDSSSSDGTRALAEKSGYRVVSISQQEFGHGRTRQLALHYLQEIDLLIYMTQDAVPAAPDSIRRLCAALQDPGVGAAYGRQLARAQAGPIERHARLFNYPNTGSVRTLESRNTLGIKAAFLSNSFAVYRRSALEAVGGFPDNVIFGEDSWVAAKLLMDGWKIAYVADATVVHSHEFTIRQEFRRYFDIGVHHEREAWLLETFGSAGGEGLKFVRSELRYLTSEKALIPSALLRTAVKLLAYRLGRFWRHLPTGLNRRLSSHPSFWKAV